MLRSTTSNAFPLEATLCQQHEHRGAWGGVGVRPNQGELSEIVGDLPCLPPPPKSY